MSPTKTKTVPKCREIIDGFAYDTETASLIHSWDNSEIDCQFEGCGGLTQNRWGHFFAYYFCDDSPEENGLIAFTQEDAIKYMQNHCPWEIEQFFGKLYEAGEGPAFTPKKQP